MTYRILLVEDEEAIRKFTKINLEREGYEILEASTGEEGIETAFDKEPHVVVLDLMLPGISGYEVCETLRTKMPRIGIIMLTAKSQEVDRILGLEKGTDDYLMKPFNPKELVLRIQALIRRLNIEPVESTDNKNIFEYGPFRMDSYSRKFYRDDVEIELTPTEIAIIKNFISMAGKALTREEILHQVWGDEYQGETKIVDVNIRRIRTKIEKNPAKPEFLETVWGVGYRWKQIN